MEALTLKRKILWVCLVIALSFWGIAEFKNHSLVNAQSCIAVPQLQVSPRYELDCGDGCTRTLNLGSHNLCFLTEVEFEDIDAGGEHAECIIWPAANPPPGGGKTTWTMRSRADDDANSWCDATCLDW